MKKMLKIKGKTKKKRFNDRKQSLLNCGLKKEYIFLKVILITALGNLKKNIYVIGYNWLLHRIMTRSDQSSA